MKFKSVFDLVEEILKIQIQIFRIDQLLMF